MAHKAQAYIDRTDQSAVPNPHWSDSQDRLSIGCAVMLLPRRRWAGARWRPRVGADASAGTIAKVAIQIVDRFCDQWVAPVAWHPARGVAHQHDVVELLAAPGADVVDDRGRGEPGVVLTVTASAFDDAKGVPRRGEPGVSPPSVTAQSAGSPACATMDSASAIAGHNRRCQESDPAAVRLSARNDCPSRCRSARLMKSSAEVRP